MLATVDAELAELEEEEELVELAPGEVSLDFLQRIYRSTQQPMSLRMRAAIEALHSRSQSSARLRICCSMASPSPTR